MNQYIVNYVTPNGWRPFGQKRLGASLIRHKYEGEFCPFTNLTLQCPSHHKTPYAFKLYALKQAQTSGADIAIWLDASFWAIRPLDDLFTFIEKNGIAVQACEFTVGQWCSDKALEVMKVSREDTLKLPLFSGGLIGIDFRNSKACDWFEDFYTLAEDGRAFRGSWTNRKQEVSSDARVHGHRHDMPVGSILLNQHGFQMQYNNTLFSYYAWYEKYKKEKDLSKAAYFLIEGGERDI